MPKIKPYDFNTRFHPDMPYAAADFEFATAYVHALAQLCKIKLPADLKVQPEIIRASKYRELGERIDEENSDQIAALHAVLEQRGILDEFGDGGLAKQLNNWQRVFRPRLHTSTPVPLIIANDVFADGKKMLASEAHIDPATVQAGAAEKNRIINFMIVAALASLLQDIRYRSGQGAHADTRGNQQ